MAGVDYVCVSKHYLYNTWVSIKQRCFNKKCDDYLRYGATGITMYSLWIDDSKSFLEWIDKNLGMRPDGYSIDRIDPWGNYEPGNLRWADRKTQRMNIRYPEQMIERLANIRRGKPSPRKGMKASDETKQKLSDSHKGKKQSLETIEKRRQALLGRKQDPDVIENRASKRRGKKMSQESRQRMSESRKIYLQNKKFLLLGHKEIT